MQNCVQSYVYIYIYIRYQHLFRWRGSHPPQCHKRCIATGFHSDRRSRRYPQGVLGTSLDGLSRLEDEVFYRKKTWENGGLMVVSWDLMCFTLWETYQKQSKTYSMENHHFEWENSILSWQFSIAMSMCNYQRISKQDTHRLPS